MTTIDPSETCIPLILPTDYMVVNNTITGNLLLIFMSKTRLLKILLDIKVAYFISLILINVAK